MKTTRPAWLIAMLLIVMLALPAAASAAPGAAAGKVNFAKAAQSDFDQYLIGTSTTSKQWMNQNYWRIRGYAPFFDSRTDWFRGGWAYENAYAIYRGYEGNDAQQILKDAQGNRLYIPFACNGSYCSQYAADIGDPTWRAKFIARAKARIARGYRGIFVDDVNFAFMVGDGAGNLVAPQDPRTGRTMTHTDWQRYMAEFMEQLRAELPEQAEIVQNQVYFHVGLSSTYVKRAIDASTHIEIERGLNDTGVTGGNGWFGYETVMAWVDYIHSRGKGVVWDIQSNWGREYALGNYFLTSTGNDGLGMDEGGLPDNFWSGFNADLGAPLNERYKWNGLFRRDFENGTVLVNQPGAPTRTVSPGGEWIDTAGNRRTSVTIGARDASVLRRSAGEGPVPTPQPDVEPAPSFPTTPAPVTKPNLPKPTTAPATDPATGAVEAIRKTRKPTTAKKLTAVIKGRLRSAKAARSTRVTKVRVTLLRKAGNGWAKVRTVTVRADSRGRFTARADGLAAGQYKANAALAGRGAKPMAWRGSLRLA